jgi:hypothetical protein
MRSGHRAVIKSKLDLLLGPKIVEEKSYAGQTRELVPV